MGARPTGALEDAGAEEHAPMPPIHCRNDNHGRRIVTVRFCAECGAVVNAKILANPCHAEAHARMRRAQMPYCIDCGEQLVHPR